MAVRKTAPVTEVPAPRSTRIITCANHKGGTGKTTTAVNVSAGLAMLTQQRVLLIDFDPRGHASLALGIDMQHVRYSVTDLLTGARPEVQAFCWDPGAHLHILPTQAALVASTELLIPVDVGYFSLEGMRQLLDAIARLRQEVPLTLATTHILLTKFDARTTLSAHVRSLLRESCGADVLHTVIHGNVDLVRAQMA